MSKIVVIDYGMGNVHSVQNALKFLGFDSLLSSQLNDIQQADFVILPGVGAFRDGMAGLKERGLDQALREYAQEGRPLLGICLGMQLLMDKSYEMGEYDGLGIVPGEVLPFPERIKPQLKIPHMGWNVVKPQACDAFFTNLPEEFYVYFVHSYYVQPQDPNVVLAQTDYGLDFCSILKQGQVYGAQFHPEKSQKVGLKMLANLLNVHVSV